jgi:hypothetical protein
VVLSFFLLAEADFSFLAEERACFGEAELAAVAPEAVPVVDAAEGLACSAPAEVLVADAVVAELVAGAAAVEPERVCSVQVAASAAGALAVELVAGAAAVVLGRVCSVVAASVADALAVELVAAAVAAAEPVLVCSELAEASAADALAAEPVAGAAEAVAPVLACSVAEVLAADELVAELAAAAVLVWPEADSQAADCDWAAVEPAEVPVAAGSAVGPAVELVAGAAEELGWELVAPAVDYDSAAHFAARHWACSRSAAGLGWVAALDSAVARR